MQCTNFTEKTSDYRCTIVSLDLCVFCFVLFRLRTGCNCQRKSVDKVDIPCAILEFTVPIGAKVVVVSVIGTVYGGDVLVCRYV